MLRLLLHVISFHFLVTLNCAETVAKEKRQFGRNPPADYEYPSCDAQGNYQPKQCYGRWTGRGW